MQSIDDTNELLYVKGTELDASLAPEYLGYRTDYLLKNLTELEDSYVICHKCRGIMTNAVIHKSCVTCKLCTKQKEAIPFVKVRDSISSLQIRCPLQRECDWKGVLSQAETHLDACEYLNLACPLKCEQVLVRSEVLIHLRTQCPMRKVFCCYCRRIGIAKDIPAHWKVCHKRPILCPNGCRSKIAREDIWKHNKTCPKFELLCPFEELLKDENALNLFCSEDTLIRELIPEHNEDEFIAHLDILHLKVLLLEQRLNEIELKLKCKKDLDGCEWEIENAFTVNTDYRQGPEFYVHGYKLRINARIKQTRSISFWLCRIEGDNDNILSGNIITECRIVLIDRHTPTKSKFNSFPLDYELEIETESDFFGATNVSNFGNTNISEKNPLFRFYFDINSSPLRDIESSYEREVEPVPTRF